MKKKYIAAAAAAMMVLGALTGCGSGRDIGRDAALEAALNDAGVNESDTTRLKVSEDRDDGRKIYEIRFDVAEKEYDYEIDAMTGEIYSHDLDAEAYVPPVSGNEITAEEAKALALSQVPGATESDIVEFETDRDDGRISYDGKIHYDGMEYEFEIDGYSESIRSWDAEPIGR